MNIVRKKYRIVTDRYAGYECQIWVWWFPFWIQLSRTNTHSSIELAEKYIQNHIKNKNVVNHIKNKNVVKYIKP